MEALAVNLVTKRYTNHVALDEVTLTVPSQSIYGLLGPNGAGKTTLIRIINQIITPDQGEIRIFGDPLQARHIATIGYLPEERGLYKKLKVGEQLVYLARLKGLSKHEALEKSKTWISRFGLQAWWDKKVEDLSKGMAQKVQFISTVMHEPKLIILDEPFSGFDPVNAQLITEEILNLRDGGSTIIFSTHRMESVEALCDHIALINRSKKILEGPKHTIKNTYRSKTFIVQHEGTFQLPQTDYQMIEQKNLADNHYESTIKILSDHTTNQLLYNLLEVTTVQGFNEKIPSMSEIFITLVKEGNHA